jgi:hypothetical protein
MTARRHQVVVRLTMTSGASHALLNANHHLLTVNVANLESDGFRDTQLVLAFCRGALWCPAIVEITSVQWQMETAAM